MRRISFKKATWDDIYTSTQKNDFINKLVPHLYSIIESSEAKKLIKVIPIEELTDVVDKENEGYKLALGSNGLLEAKLIYSIPAKVTKPTHTCTRLINGVPEGTTRIDSYKEVKKEEYVGREGNVGIIEKYRLDYKKLNDIRKKIMAHIIR